MIAVLFLISTVSVTIASAQACSSNADCEDGYYCLISFFSGYCTISCSGAAAAANYTDADLYCQDNYGLIYNNAVCNEETGSCEAGEETTSGCSTDEDCTTLYGDSFACNQDTGECEYSFSFGCSDDADCGEDQVCDESTGICVTLFVCSTDEDCTALYGDSYACNQDTGDCEYDYSWSSCTEDADCEEDQVCDDSTGLCFTVTICDEEECKAMYSELATCGETLAVCMDNECLEDADCEEDEVCSTTLALSYEPYYCTETCETDEDCQDNLLYSSCVNFLEISGEDVSICYVDSSTGSTSNFTFDSTLNGGIDMDNSEQPEGNAAETMHVAVAAVSAGVFVIALL